jgi:hypothetical protein
VTRFQLSSVAFSVLIRLFQDIGKNGQGTARIQCFNQFTLEALPQQQQWQSIFFFQYGSQPKIVGGAQSLILCSSTDPVPWHPAIAMSFVPQAAEL